MTNSPSKGRPWIDRKLNLEFDPKEDNIWIESSYTLRKLIGVMGMALPLLLWLFLLIDTAHGKPLPSISHYYFTRVDGIFIIIVGVLAIFLIIYKGKDRIDFYTSLLAGIFALLLLLFPTNSLIDQYPDVNLIYSNTVIRPSSFRVLFHYISAAIFLTSLAFMALFIFTRTDKTKNPTKLKKVRNKIYILCGSIMVLALLVMLARPLGIIDKDFYDANNLTFWMESVAIEFFGFSWLVKGEAILGD